MTDVFTQTNDELALGDLFPEHAGHLATALAKTKPVTQLACSCGQMIEKSDVELALEGVELGLKAQQRYTIRKQGSLV